MAKLFYTNIDLKGNQLQNGVIHNATIAPSDPKSGQVYYNTADKLMYQYNGEEWVVVGGSVANLDTDVKLVVTGSTTSGGTATLKTTALKDMKVGVELENLTTVNANTTLEGEFQAIDTALQGVKTSYVKAGDAYTNGQLLVAGVDGNGIKTASASGYSIEATLDPTHSTNIPTSEAVATYIGSLAGGINYKGTIGSSDSDTVKTLPTDTTKVKVGDAYAVTTAGKYITTATKDSQVGDLIICNGTSPISWTEVPINFTVEDKALRNFAPASKVQTIAVVDGKPITMSLQKITIEGNEVSGFVTGIAADDNNQLTLTKGNALTTVNPTTAAEGVVTSVVHNGNTVNVTYKKLAGSTPDGIQYVTSVSQASDGEITVEGTTFDSTVPTIDPSTTNAPTTSAVKTYVDGLIESLDGSATIATEDGGVVTLKAGIVETDGKIANNSGSDIKLAKVATTGKAEDVDATAIDNGDGVVIVPEGTVQESLQYIARKLDEAVAGSVTSFGEQTGDITVGNGLKMTVNEADSEVSTNVTGYIVNTAGDGNALNIDPKQIDSNYTTGNTANLATVATVTKALNDLDVTITDMGAGKTLVTLTETNGKIAATFQDISITSSQINNLSNEYSSTGEFAVTGKAVKEALGTLDVEAFALSNGGDTSIVVYGISETDGKIAADTTTEKTWNFDGTYNASTNRIALQSTVTNALGTLNGTHNVVAIGDYIAGTGEFATKKIEFFDGTQTNGLLGTSSSATDTLYITKAVTAEDPLIVKSDLSGIVGAMVYKGVVDDTHPLPATDVQAGWTYVVGTAGTYAEQACEVGDMIIAKDDTPTWNVINGENQVTNKNATLTAGGGVSNIAVVDGTTITANVQVTAGSATIANVSEGVVTITPTVSQEANTGTIQEASGTKITLAKVATTGKSENVSYDNTTSGLQATNTQAAISELNSKINTANITIDGKKGTITTGNGLTDVNADNGSFGIKIADGNANGLSVGASGLAMAIATDLDFGTVKVTTGNGLTLTNGVIAYSHNTTPITVASKDTSNIITINGTLEPTASGAITPSGAIELAAVAASGAASDVTYSATIGGSTVNNVDDALDALNVLSGNAVYVFKSGNLSFNANGIATITISGADLLGSAITEIRDNTNNVVECDVTYTGKETINVGINGSLPTGTSLYAIVHYKKA